MLPWLNKGFYYTVQLTLAAVARLAIEISKLFRSQEINQSSLFPRGLQFLPEQGGECSDNLVLSSKGESAVLITDGIPL